jgi:hypothetical protein
MTDKLSCILPGRKNTRREKGLINVIIALMSVEKRMDILYILLNIYTCLQLFRLGIKEIIDG